MDKRTNKSQKTKSEQHSRLQKPLVNACRHVDHL